MSLLLAAASVAAEEKPEYVPDQIIVGLESPGAAALNAVRDILPGEVKRESFMRSVRPPSDKKEHVIVQLPAGVSVPDAVERLKAKNSPHIRYVEPNYMGYRQSFSEPDDTHFDHQYALHNEGQDFWPLVSPNWGGTVDKDLDWLQVIQDYIDDDTDYDETVVVAVIDSGIHYNHEDLTNMMWVNSGETWLNGTDDDSNGYVDDYYGMDPVSHSAVCPYVSDDGDPSDGNGHGTHVAGIIAAQGDNAKGISGIGGVGETSTGAPPIKLMACKIFNNIPGSGFAASDLAYCYDYVADMYDDGVNVLVTNNSIRGSNTLGTAVENAIDRLETRSILLIAAAGNFGQDNGTYPQYPGSYTDTNIVAVGAVGSTGEKMSWSNYGDVEVDVAAPGNRILSTDIPARTNFVSEDFEDCTDGELPTGWTQDGDETWGCYDTGTTVQLRADYANSAPYSASKTSTVYSPVYDMRTKPNSILDVKYYVETDDGGDNGDGARCEVYIVSPCWGSPKYYTAWQMWSKNGDNYPSPQYTLLDVERSAHQYWQFRCRWFTDATDNNYFGAAIEEFEISYVGATNNVYDFKNGTSMATPHVAGAAALHYAMDDTLSMSDVKGLLLDSVDAESDWVGKSVTEGNLNLWQTDQDSDGDLDREDNCRLEANADQADEDSTFR
jgi:subtilisin family serine protease